ncbi:MAG: GGDEF domain-containing protein [Proteobacteria bacterium]|nr:GGDEF domain-containing protein [Pseudomonadota bacterium]
MTADPPAALEQALEQSHGVKVKVEACADDLALQNDAVQQQIDRGATTLPAGQALQDSQVVEATVQECADDLDEVTATLARGIADIKQVEVALTRSRVALVEAEASLLTAQEDERHATMRALHDAATGLPNRVLFDDRVTQGISLAERHGWSLAVMFLDLDRFKSINDDHGHAAGDLVLREVASRLSQHARDEDTICRGGGDEFLYLLVNPKSRADVERKALAVLSDIAQAIKVGGRDLVIRASIGVALYPRDGTTVDQLVRNADTAMYRAKNGGCGYVLFSPAQATSGA